MGLKLFELQFSEKWMIYSKLFLSGPPTNHNCNPMQKIEKFALFDVETDIEITFKIKITKAC